MNRTHLVIAAAIVSAALGANAQNTGPIVTSQIANFTQYAGAPSRSIDLSTAFADSDVSAAVRMTTVLGTIDVGLFGQQKSVTVANFLKYVDQGRYFVLDPTTNQLASSFVHRAFTSPNIIQGGGFIGTVDPADATKQNAKATQVLSFAPVQNEPGIPNKRGTIAMAKLANDPNSATSQWFINTSDNTSLDNPANNGGYTVFGRVMNNGMSVVDAITALPRFNAGAPFDTLPLRNYTAPNPIKVSNLVSIRGIAQIPPLTFSAMSDNANVGVTLSGTKLLVSGNNVGSALVTVTATDLDGASVSQSFTVNVVSAPGRLVNVSTRMQVGLGDNVLIGGFIMRGPSPKRLLIRAIGPSSGVPGALADTILELHDSTGALIAANDNWGDAPNKQDMLDTGLPPPGSPNESAILTTVPSDPNNAAYTAIVKGANNTTGVGVVEVYDLDSGPGSTLLNISTRGQVNVDPNALIGGFFLGGTESKRIFIRAIGPSLANANVPNPLADPVLDLFDANGTVLDSNNDWGSSPQQAEIQASGLAPTNAKESAVIRTLPVGAYTAIVRGVNNTTGVGVVEVYQLP